MNRCGAGAYAVVDPDAVVLSTSILALLRFEATLLKELLRLRSGWCGTTPEWEAPKGTLPA